MPDTNSKTGLTFTDDTTITPIWEKAMEIYISEHFQSKQPKVLDVGTHEGQRIIWLMDAIFRNPYCFINDNWDVRSHIGRETRDRCIENARIYLDEHPGYIEMVEGPSLQVLAELAQRQCFSFDFIYNDALKKQSKLVLFELVMMWKLLGPNGILLVSGYASSPQVKTAVDAFISCFSDEMYAHEPVCTRDYSVDDCDHYFFVKRRLSALERI